MKRFLITVDMQNDFVDGALGTREAAEIVPRVAEKIVAFEGEIIATLDTHTEDYMNTREGKHLPVPHCIRGTEGWKLNKTVLQALEQKGYTALEKPTFGCVRLPELIRERAAGDEEIFIELIGLCTDICVISNALLLKAAFPETEIFVDARCCAGVTPDTHNAALTAMQCCQIGIRKG